MHEFLEAALSEESLVELLLEGPEGGSVLGWVVGLGPEWVVLHQVNDGLWIDGYAAIPLSRVDAYRDRDETDDGFVGRVAERRGFGRRIPADLAVHDAAAVIASLAGPHLLVALDFEDAESTYSEIGELVTVDAEAATLRSIGVDARWEGLETIALAGLVQVTVDDGYLQALALGAAD